MIIKKLLHLLNFNPFHRKSESFKRQSSDRLDILFVIPPVLRFMKKSSVYYPLGLGSMVAYLKQFGFNAEIYNSDIHETNLLFLQFERICVYLKAKILLKSDFNVDFAKKWPEFHKNVSNIENKIWQDIAGTLRRENPAVIGISSRVVDIPATLILAELAKRVNPDVKVIIGGASAATCKEYLLQSSFVDCLVIGEGEETVRELIENFSAGVDPVGQNIRGIAYRDQGNNIVITDDRPLISDLDTLPFPDRNCMYVINKDGSKKYVHECRDILSSRGCPYSCTFCCAFTAWRTRRTRFRSVESILSEIEYLQTEYGQNEYIFWDDLFTADRDRVLAICHGILERKLDISWMCLARINTIDAELLNIMKQAGCSEIQIGIESGSNRVLEFIKKGITREMVFEKIPIIRNAAISWRIFLIIGFPTETREEMDATLRLISEMRPTYIDLSLFCPYPGTDLHKYLKDNGMLGDDFMKSDMWYPYNNYTGTMNNEEFQEYAFNALKIVDNYNIHKY